MDLVLTEIEKKLLPGLKAAMDESLNFYEITNSSVRALIFLAIERMGNQNRAAARLGIYPAMISRVLHGKSYRDRPSRRKN